LPQFVESKPLDLYDHMPDIQTLRDKDMLKDGKIIYASDTIPEELSDIKVELDQSLS
jgi:hypothetical protein